MSSEHNKNERIKKEIKKYLLLLAANFCLALALIAFINNADIMTGGLGGISVIVGKVFSGFEYINSLVITGLSWVLFFVGWIFKGRKFALKTLFSTITYPLFISLFEYISNNYHLFASANNDTGLKIIYAILAGILVGTGLGLAFKVGGSTGGVDIPAVVIAERFHISIDKVIFFIDGFIIVGGFFVLPFINVVIGVLSNIVYTFVIDKIIVGGKKSIFVQIISEKNDEINDFIQNKINRGSTFFSVKGGYKKDDHSLLEVIVYRREYAQLIDFIHLIDENAFVISLDAKEVFGEGFKQYDKETIK